MSKQEQNDVEERPQRSNEALLRILLALREEYRLNHNYRSLRAARREEDAK